MRIKMRGTCLSIATLFAMLLAFSFLLSGCAIFGGATPVAAPTPTENIIPAPQTFVTPSMPCDRAVQLIQQKQISIVRFWYTKQGDFSNLSVVQIQATPVPDAPPGVDDIFIYSGSEYASHHLPTAECLAQVQAAIKQVNATLPASQQIKVEHKTTYS